MKKLIADETMKRTLEGLKTYREYIAAMLDNDGISIKLTRHKYVIEVNEIYCIGVNRFDKEENKLSLINDNFPDMFESTEADDIIKNVSCMDVEGRPITPRKVLWNDWYSKRLTSINSTIKLIEHILSDKGSDQND